MSRRRLRARRRRRGGLTSAEVIISTVLVGLVAIGAMRAVGAVFRTRAATDHMHRATTLAYALMTEVMQAAYEDAGSGVAFGPEAGETSPALRAGFDDVDDYHGWSESPPRPKDSTAALTGCEGWSRSVQVSFADPSAPQNVSVADTGLKRITVTVTDPAGRQTALTAFRSRWGALERPPDADTTVRSWIGSRLQIGTQPPLYSGTNLPNPAQDR